MSKSREKTMPQRGENMLCDVERTSDLSLLYSVSQLNGLLSEGAERYAGLKLDQQEDLPREPIDIAVLGITVVRRMKQRIMRY
jgi:hypothetical protein